jgi:hypothetical protein
MWIRIGKDVVINRIFFSNFFTTKELTRNVQVEWGISNLKNITNKKDYLVINLYTDYYYNY